MVEQLAWIVFADQYDKLVKAHLEKQGRPDNYTGNCADQGIVSGCEWAEIENNHNPNACDTCGYQHHGAQHLVPDVIAEFVLVCVSVCACSKCYVFTQAGGACRKLVGTCQPRLVSHNMVKTCKGEPGYEVYQEMRSVGCYCQVEQTALIISEP